MANLTKDEVNVLAQRAYDIRVAEVELYNNEIKNSPEYIKAIESYTHPAIELAKAYEALDQKQRDIIAEITKEKAVLVEKVRALDPNLPNYYSGLVSEQIKSVMMYKEVYPQFPLKSIKNATKLENKLKSVAVMNKTKTPTEVLEILLTVNEDE